MLQRTDAAQLTDALCGGDDNAYHILLEAGHEIIPDLVDEFANHADGSHRAKIIEVIWQQRAPSTIAFLASALNDKYPVAWKQALDGLVCIAGSDSRKVLTDFLAEHAPDDIRYAWVAEAIEQIAQ